MSKTFSRASTAYAESGAALVSGQPDRSTRVKLAAALSVTTDNLEGDSAEALSPQPGINEELAVFVGRTSANLFYSTDASTVTKWASPGDAYQAMAKSVGSSQYDALTLEGVYATGLEIHHWSDITGTPTDTRCKLGGSVSTSAEFHDRVGNNLMTNSGITPGATSADVGATGKAYEEGPILDTASDFVISIKAKVPTLSAAGVIWHLRPDSGQDGRLELSLSTNGNALLRVGATGSAATLVGSAGPGDYDDDVLREFRVTGTRSGANITATLAAYTAAGALVDSDTSASLTYTPEAASDFIIGSRTVGGTAYLVNGELSDLDITEDGTQIRYYPLDSNSALVDASLPASARWQDNGVGYDPNSGTWLWGYYANPATPVDTYLYRSTDGIHHPIVYTNTADTTSSNCHTHAVYWSENLSRWLVAFGDSDNKIEVSSADGLTFTEAITTDQTAQQPIGYSDHPDGGNKIVVAGDDALMIYERDYTDTIVLGGSALPTTVAIDHGAPRYDSAGNALQRFAWPFVNFGGVCISGMSVVADLGLATIHVGTTPLNMATAYRFPTGKFGLKNLTYLNGKVIGGLKAAGGADDYDQIIFDLPSVSLATTNRVSAGATNLMGEDESKGDTLTGSNASGADELEAGTGGTVGDATIKANKTNDTNFRIRFDAGAATATNSIHGIAYVRGLATDRVDLGVYDVTAAAGMTNEAQGLLSDNFVPWLLPPNTAANTGNHRIDLYHSTGRANSVVENSIEADRLALFQDILGPHPWVLGGSTQAAEALTETVSRGASWTETITFWPRTDSLQLTGDVPVFTYSGASSDATLVWDGANERWQVQVTGEADVNGAATYFNRNEQVTVTMTVSASGTDFAIANGGYSATLNGAAKADLYSADIDFTTGDAAGAGVLWAEFIVDEGPRPRLSQGKLSGIIGAPLRGRIG